MIRAGAMRDRLRFERREASSDDLGNKVGAWSPAFTCAAARKALRGGEEVMGHRLAGRQPIVFTVRASSETRAVTPEWRAVCARTGTVYAIRAAVDPDGCGERIDILCESGSAP